MALSGLEIYKMLPGGQKPPHPKANCKECGYPTCLAFAMKLAAKQAELSACQYVSAESASEAVRRGRAADPLDHAQQQRPQVGGRQRDGALPPREDLLPQAGPVCAGQRRRRAGCGAADCGRSRRLRRGLRRHALEHRRLRRGLHLRRRGDLRRDGQGRLRRQQEAIDPHGR